jgi:hypothetical protein
MILECPHCGFSGRLPDHAKPTAHRARCPKCRCGFDIGDFAGDPEAPDSLDRSPLASSDSSYELDPIVAGPDDPWDGPWSDGPDGDPWDDPWPEDPGAARPPAARPTLAGRRLVGRPSDRIVRAFRPSMLRIRLFQAWAVAFMIAAAAIGARTAVAAWRFDDARFFSAELLRPVAAVVLLVGAAALICLSVDISRRLSWLTYGRSAPIAHPSAPAPLPSRSRAE